MLNSATARLNIPLVRLCFVDPGQRSGGKREQHARLELDSDTAACGSVLTAANKLAQLVAESELEQDWLSLSRPVANSRGLCTRRSGARRCHVQERARGQAQVRGRASASARADVRSAPSAAHGAGRRSFDLRQCVGDRPDYASNIVAGGSSVIHVGSLRRRASLSRSQPDCAESRLSSSGVTRTIR